jgi:O-antigen/teichoic acid export membrane protein
MRNVVVSLIQLGGMQIVIALTAIVRNKILAYRLGAGGYGEFSQVALIAVTVSVVVAFGLALSLNRNVAAVKDHDERQRLLSQANGVNLLLSSLFVALAAAVLLFRPSLLGAVGLTPTPTVIGSALILLAFIPLDAAVKHRIAFLTAILDISGMTSGRSLALIIGTVLCLPLVWYLGLIGAALQLTLLTGTILVFLDRRSRRIGFRPWAVAFEMKLVRYLAAFGIASLVAGFAQQLSDVLVRSALIRTMDAAQNGIYQSAMAVTYQIRAVVLGSVGSYSIATLSQDATRERVIESANRLLAVVLPISALSMALLGLLSGPAILILYSGEFLPAQRLLPYLLGADFLQVVIWVMGAPLLVMNRVGAWLTLSLIVAAARTVGALLLMAPFGIVGVALAYALSAALSLVLNAYYYFRIFRFTISRLNVGLFATGGVVTGAMAYAGSKIVLDPRIQVTGTIVLVAYALICLHVVVGLPQAWASVRQSLRRKAGS